MGEILGATTNSDHAYAAGHEHLMFVLLFATKYVSPHDILRKMR